MKIFWHLLFLLSTTTIFSGCGNSSDGGGKATLRLELPSSFSGSENALKTTSLEASTLKACFAISLRGDDIESTNGDSCNPEYGQFVGLVEGGQTVEVSVERGSDRVIDLYYVASEDCSELGSPLSLGTMGSNKVHRLAQKRGIKLNSSNVSVTLPIQLPGPANTLDRVYGLPSACRSGTENLLAENRDVKVVTGALTGQFDSGRGISLRLSTISVQRGTSNKKVRLKPTRLGVKQ